MNSMISIQPVSVVRFGTPFTTKKLNKDGEEEEIIQEE